MVTAKDVAERLQVSISTVGRALADDNRISAETRQRVREAATEMGYAGNSAARIVRGQSSKLVGLIVPDIRNSFYASVAHQLSATLSQYGYQLMLAESGDDRSTELRHVRDLVAGKAAGLIVVPSGSPHPEAVKLLESIPHVQLLRKQPGWGDQCFGIGDNDALREATAHLMQLGHTRVAYIGGPLSLSTGYERFRGYQSVVRDNQMADEPQLQHFIPPASVSGASNVVRELLASTHPPTGLVLGSVQLTTGVLDALAADGTAVPDQLSIVGFGDEPGFSWWGPGLTTMTLPVAAAAASCALWVVDHLRAPADSPEAYTSLVSGRLHIRGSTAPLD